MEYRNFDMDFAKRTWENLVYIRERSCEGVGVYEVTQLINSFLGLIVFPFESAKNKAPLPLTVDEDLMREINAAPNKRDTYCYDEKNFSGDSSEALFWHFRNAVAHRRISCHSENGKIDSIEIKDGLGKQSYQNTLTISQLERLTEACYRSIVTKQA